MRLTFIGFGEVGQRFAGQLSGVPDVQLAAYDLKFADPSAPNAGIAHSLGVTVAPSAADAANGADIVISAVTAMSAGDVARQAVEYLSNDQIFCDINSISPNLKSQLSQTFLVAGKHYVEGAVMGPVAEPGIKVPILSGGAKARELATALNAVGMNVTPVTEVVGRAAATKLCRSIMIKGIEALIIELQAASSHWQVEDDVFASLAQTFPSINWPQMHEVMSSRVRRHGVRRAGEMRECADMLDEMGRSGEIARAIANVHEKHATT